MTTKTDVVTQVYQIFIKAKPEKVWEAITSPEWTQQYGYRTANEYDLRPDGAYRALADEGLQAAGMPAVVVDGTVIECDPPRRLVHTWRFLWSDEVRSEGPTTVTIELEDMGKVTKVTLVHELERAPVTAAQLAGAIPGAGGGWAYVLSDLKSLLETGSALPG